MSFLTEILVSIFALIYHTLKWLEKKIYSLPLISPEVQIRVQLALEKIGIVIHFTETNTQSDEEKVRRRSKFKDLIHIKVHRKKELFCSIASFLTLAWGEGYLKKQWDCDEADLPELGRRLMKSKIHVKYFNIWNRFLLYLSFQLCNLQNEKRAWIVAKEHYDLGNELFESFLDPYMNYTCGYWKKAKNLNEAQVDKMDLIAKKLDLKKGMRILDIGSGWGGLCKYLAEKYDVECVGVTISKEGVTYSKEFCKGLKVDIKLQDYRSIDGKFDRIVSVGMFEHVGRHNYETFFEVVHKCLKDDGIFLLHTIGRSHLTTPRFDIFTHTYIFPNGDIPHHTDIANCISGLFILEDWHNFGPDYAKTLNSWWKNFEANWPRLAEKHDDGFRRLWTFYLTMAQGCFSSRSLQLFQIVLSKDGLENDYRAAR